MSAGTAERVTACLGGDESLVTAIGEVIAADSEVLLVAPPGGTAAPEDWAVAAAVNVLGRLRGILEQSREGLSRHAIIVAVEPAGPEAEHAAATAATTAAMRGIAQSLTREVDPALLRVNVVIGSEARRADLIDTARFLSSPDGSYFAGATLKAV